MKSTFNTKWKLYYTWSLLANFIIIKFIKNCFKCSLLWLLYIEFHSNILSLLVDTSPEIEITGHILMYIYQRSKTFLKLYHNEPKRLNFLRNSGELKESVRVCNESLLLKIMYPWGGSVFTHHCGYIYILRSPFKVTSNIFKSR